MTSNFRISKNLEDCSSNFTNFRKALFQFRILLWKVSKTIFRFLYFLGKVRITFAIELNSSIANAMCTFPQKYKHLNIVLRTFQSRIRNWKRAFRKFGKFEERSSKFLEIRKLEAISNEWTHGTLMSASINTFNYLLGFYHSDSLLPLLNNQSRL